MQTTTHYALSKPDPTDTYNKATDNTNMDTIDGQMYANAQAAATAQTTANAAIPQTEAGAANGVATLDATGNVPQSQLSQLKSVVADLVGDTSVVLSGGVATKDGVTATQLDVTATNVYFSGGQHFNFAASTPGQFTTSVISTTYYLDYNPDGTTSWGTAHSVQTGYVPICQVTTDASGNIVTVTDERPVSVNLFGLASWLVVPAAWKLTKTGTPVTVQPVADAAAGTHVLSFKTAAGTEYGFIDNDGLISGNSAQFSNSILMGGDFTSASPTASNFQVDGNAGGSAANAQHFYWSRTGQISHSLGLAKEDYGLWVYDGTTYWSPFGLDYTNKVVGIGSDAGWLVKTAHNVLDDGSGKPVWTNTIGGDSGFGIRNYGGALGANATGANIGGTQTQLNSTALFTESVAIDTDGTAAITKINQFWYSYHLSAAILQLNHFTGSVSTNHNTLDDGTGLAQVGELMARGYLGAGYGGTGPNPTTLGGNTPGIFLGWNYSGGTGEGNIFTSGQGGSGGLQVYNTNNAAYPTWTQIFRVDQNGNLYSGTKQITPFSIPKAVIRTNFSNGNTSNIAQGQGFAGVMPFVYHATQWPSASFIAEISFNNGTAGDTSYVGVWDLTAGGAVAGSEISTVGAAVVTLQTGTFTLTDGHAYSVYSRVSAGTANIYSADIIALL